MPYSIKYFDNFAGGENSIDAPDHLRPNQLRHCVNADLIASGGYKTRTGISEHTAYTAGYGWTSLTPGGTGVVGEYYGLAKDGNYILAGDWSLNSGSTASIGRLWRSTDNGVTWAETRPNGDAGFSWQSCMITGAGQYMYAMENDPLGGTPTAWRSSDYGVTWTELKISAASFGWLDADCDGAELVFILFSDTTKIYYSSNYGATITQLTSPYVNVSYDFDNISVSGGKILLCNDVNDGVDGRVWYSANAGTSFTNVSPLTGDNHYYNVEIDGTYLWTSTNVTAGHTYKSTNGGASWTEVFPNGVDSESAPRIAFDGAYGVIHGDGTGFVYFTTDYGVTWKNYNTGLGKTIQALTIDGNSVLAAAADSYIRMSVYGATDLRTLMEYEYLDADGIRKTERYALYNGDIINADDETDVLVAGFGDYVSWEVYYDKLYLLGAGIFKVYSGYAGTVTDVSSGTAGVDYSALKRCKYLEQRGDRMFAAGDEQNPNFLYYCPPLDPTEWDPSGTVAGTGTIKSITDDGDIITGLKEFQGNLVVTKRRTAFAWSGYDPTADVYFKQLPVHEGCISEETMVIIDDMLVYMGENGVYALLSTSDETIATRVLSDNIMDRMFLTQHNIAAPHLDSSCAVFYKDRYMVSCRSSSTSTYNDIVFVFYPYAKTWTTVPGDQYSMDAPWSIYEGWNISSFLASLDGNLYSASSVAGRVHLHTELYNDLGVAIHMDVIHRQEYFDDKVRLKKWKRLYVFFKQMTTGTSEISVSAIVDGEEFLDTVYGEEMSLDVTLVWDDDNWDSTNWAGAVGVEDFASRYAYINARGNRLAFRVQTDATETAVMIYGIAAEYKIKKPARRA